MEQNIEAGGKGFLRVTGILMIVCGGILCLIGIFCLIFTIIGMGSLQDSADAILGTGASGDFLNTLGTVGVIIIVYIICFAGAILELITGIVGTRNAGKPYNYRRCKVLGIIVLVLQIISLILTVLAMIIVNDIFSVIGYVVGIDSAVLFPWWMIIIIVVLGLAIPVLFLVGVSRNKFSYLQESITYGAGGKYFAKEEKAQYKAEKAQNKADKARAKAEKAMAKADKAEKAREKAEKAQAKAAAKAQAKAEAYESYSEPQTQQYTQTDSYNNYTEQSYDFNSDAGQAQQSYDFNSDTAQAQQSYDFNSDAAQSQQVSNDTLNQ